MTELHHVPNGSRIRLKPEPVSEGGTVHPPSHREFQELEELEFKHIDGMYSLCYDDRGNAVHLVAWADVEVVREGYKDNE